jgi:hypothetical protein
MNIYCKENLHEIKHLIALLSDEQYAYNAIILNGASIGQHTRHILEFYTCLISGIQTGIVNYDSRARNIDLEVNRDVAIAVIETVCSDLDAIDESLEIQLHGDFTPQGGTESSIRTFVNREMAYCLEHSIHHQALIKVSLMDQKIGHLAHADFGLAPATIRHKGILLFK